MTGLDNESLATLLDSIEEDVIYIIECLTQEFTGEAKHELFGLASRLTAVEELPDECRQTLLAGVENARRLLSADSYSKAARQDVITLRRRLANTVWRLRGAAPVYNYADPLV